jgi:hypothetical protein
MHVYDGLIFFVSSFDSTILGIGNVVGQDRKKCV